MAGQTHRTIGFRGILAGTLACVYAVAFLPTFADDLTDSDSDGDGWTDVEELAAGTNMFDETDPWDSDGDGIPDYLEFENATDPLDPNDPPKVVRTFSSVAFLATSSVTEEDNNNYLPIFSLTPENWIENPNAWGGTPIKYGMVSGSGAWSALNGSGIEVWKNGYFELEGDKKNSGAKCDLSKAGLVPGEYIFEWSDQGRWKRVDGGNPGNAYTVKVVKGVDNKKLYSKEFNPGMGEAANRMVFFNLLQEDLDAGVKIILEPVSNNTTGVLILARSMSLKRVYIKVTQNNYPTEIVGDPEDCGGYATQKIESIPKGTTVAPANAVAWITAEPEPAKLIAKIVNFPDSVIVEWDGRIESERKERRAQTIAGKSIDYREFSVTNREDKSNNVATNITVIDITALLGGGCIGGKVTLCAKFYVENNPKGEILSPFVFVIRGKNPKDEDAKEYIETVMGKDFPYAWAIAEHETRQSDRTHTYKYNQFNACPPSFKGLPNLGKPDGWGLGQIDYSSERKVINGVVFNKENHKEPPHYASTDEVYNWHTNAQSMKRVLSKKRDIYRQIKIKVEEYVRAEHERNPNNKPWIDLPEMYEYEGKYIEPEYLSTMVYYNGAVEIPEYKTKPRSSYFPWKLVEDGVVIKDGKEIKKYKWKFVDNKNGYATKILKVYKK